MKVINIHVVSEIFTAALSLIVSVCTTIVALCSTKEVNRQPCHLDTHTSIIFLFSLKHVNTILSTLNNLHHPTREQRGTETYTCASIFKYTQPHTSHPISRTANTDQSALSLLQAQEGKHKERKAEVRRGTRLNCRWSAMFPPAGLV